MQGKKNERIDRERVRQTETGMEGKTEGSAH